MGSRDMIRPSGASTRKNFIISKIWQSFHKTKLLSQSRHPRNVAKENCELGRPFFQASQPSFTVRDTEDCDEVYKFAKKISYQLNLDSTQRASACAGVDFGSLWAHCTAA